MEIISEENISNNYSETSDLGKKTAENILKRGSSGKAVVLGLEGELGAGKTAFIQGFSKGLKIKQRVISPTFVIMNVFPLKNRNFKRFYHFDCYRINDYKEIENLGFKDIISDPQNIVCIEWSERIKSILPKNTIRFIFSIEGENKRKIKVLNYGKG